MADSSQTRIFLGKVNDQFLHAHWWLWSQILDAKTLLHLGRAKVWAEGDLGAARSFCPPRLSFAAVMMMMMMMMMMMVMIMIIISRRPQYCYQIGVKSPTDRNSVCLISAFPVHLTLFSPSVILKTK